MWRAAWVVAAGAAACGAAGVVAAGAAACGAAGAAAGGLGFGAVAGCANPPVAGIAIAAAIAVIVIKRFSVMIPLLMLGSANALQDSPQNGSGFTLFQMNNF